ncbi:FAD dependent oxidoreductase [Exidia glandulosa HHB12029]|uniref:L-2-hydroxyglutarate dehydrogenase, mitochondrial n=1 Tax=Exidia glandulosa HHB12029 TaxID=1314781 RepID=A0A165QN05_EXIGL|nr:FAD dependent oxidoreductase [Exidia glandulosa HHB12029]
MVRGLRAALNASGRYKFVAPEQEVDHVVIGAGVVGLAIAARLSRLYGDKSTVLLERHSSAGQETSSRNSEVIHAGIYYPPESLKTRLCLRGRALLKEHCETHGVPHAFPGKLVFATAEQRDYVSRLHSHSQSLSKYGSLYPMPRTELISGDEAREMQPDLAPDIAAALHSLDTGIVDSHTLMQSLEAQITDSEAGDLAYQTRVVRVDPQGEDGWVVQVDSGDSILARNLINSSGLSANLVLNALLPAQERIPMYFARGSYASYHGPGVAGVSKLLYPVPKARKDAQHAFHSLGTHLTLDLEGNIRFGPDLEWIEPPASDGAEFSEREEDIDFWAGYHRPEDSQEKLKAIYDAVREYLPGISLDGLQIDYAGIRPKLGGPGSAFEDFAFRVDHSSGMKGVGAPMVTMLGIESPGLTSALSIAEHVEGMLYPRKE